MSRVRREVRNLLRDLDSWAETEIIKTQKRKNAEIFKHDYKRRKHTEPSRGIMVVRAVLVDPEYEEFLENLGLFLNGNVVNVSQRGEDNLGFNGQMTLVEEEEEVDPMYEKFLENVRDDGNCHVLEMEKEDGTMALIKYGGEETNMSIDFVQNEEEKTYMSRGSRERKKNVIVLVPQKTEPVDFGMADKANLEYIGHKHHGKMVKLKENLAIEPNFEGRGLKRNINRSTSDGVLDDVEVLGDGVEIDPQKMLERKLREVLRKPFDKKELKEKLKAARIHKQKERTRITRGRAVSYPTEEKSPSYLDLHPSLASMLNNAIENQYTEKALALLRCLFFYYEKLSHEKSNIKWEKTTFLKKMMDGKEDVLISFTTTDEC